MNRTIGFIFILLGLAAIAYGGLTYTRSEPVIVIGPVEAATAPTPALPVSPIAGALTMLAGGTLLFAHKRDL